jgi:hypothetical protein
MVKFVKRAVKSAKRFVKKRYNIGKKKRGGPNTGQIAADVMKLMTMVNAEKKIYNLPLQSNLVAQVAINLTGAQCFDVTPMMAQGADQFQRNGISIKLHSQLWQIQIQQSSGALSGNTLHMELWYNSGPTRDQATLLTDMYDPSIFSGVIDMTSTRNPDHFKDYRLLRKFSKKLHDPAYAGDLVNATFTIPIKFNRGKGHHLRYTGAGYTNYLADVQSGQIFLIMRADNGNRSPSTASTLPVAVTAVSTGILVKWANKTWFYDN